MRGIENWDGLAIVVCHESTFCSGDSWDVHVPKGRKYESNRVAEDLRLTFMEHGLIQAHQTRGISWA